MFKTANGKEGFMKVRMEHLVPHPESCSHFSEVLKKKLTEHIRATGLYPPLIVRTLKKSAKYFSGNGDLQILDGHLRYGILKELGVRTVEVRSFGALTDKQAELFLLTLNHLRSVDDPARRGALLRRHVGDSAEGLKRMTRLLPESKVTLRRLLDLAGRGPVVIPPVKLPALPKPFAVYLSGDQHDLLARTLEAIKRTTGGRSNAEAVEYLTKEYLSREEKDNNQYPTLNTQHSSKEVKRISNNEHRISNVEGKKKTRLSEDAKPCHPEAKS